ncbi:carboxypeptidase B-like [Amphiura filiformis]|uniref:carboxypeptidase B-like n=1 Tax=Amphiura filiformis TaxID=82378 RepID=UPI003B22523A
MYSGRWLLLLVCATLCLAEKVRYDGYQVLRITPKTDHDINVLRNLVQNLLSFWSEPSYVNKPVDIMISPLLSEEALTYLDQQRIHTDVMIKNVQELIDEEQKGLNRSAFDYNKYNTYEVIQQWITDTAASYITATEGSLGTSYEGRNIGYLKISTGGNKKAVVIHGAIHAREWITPATVIYLAKYLVEGGADARNLLNKFDFYIIPVLNVDGYAYTWTSVYGYPGHSISTGGNKKAVVIHGAIHAREWITPATVIYLAKYLVEGGADARNLLNKFDFYIIPVLNVDGYAYTWTSNRLWRKTRKPNVGSDCVGTDPNRNFATGWGGAGSSEEPCSEIYHGTVPFSEPETAAIRDFVSSLGGGDGVALYIDYHCFSQLWLIPYGYTDTVPANYDTQFAGAEAACTAIKGVHGMEYVSGNIYDVIYPASGESIDYMYAGQGVQFSYSPEGRDTGKYGFILPDCYIQPSGEENWAAFKAICNFAYTNI